MVSKSENIIVSEHIMCPHCEKEVHFLAKKIDCPYCKKSFECSLIRIYVSCAVGTDISSVLSKLGNVDTGPE